MLADLSIRFLMIAMISNVAIADIDGTSSYVDRIFIYATGSGASTKVGYIERYGTAVKGQGEHYERFTP